MLVTQVKTALYNNIMFYFYQYNLKLNISYSHHHFLARCFQTDPNSTHCRLQEIYNNMLYNMLFNMILYNILYNIHKKI